MRWLSGRSEECVVTTLQIRFEAELEEVVEASGCWERQVPFRCMSESSNVQIMCKRTVCKQREL